MAADTVRIDRIVAHPECQPRERMDAGVVAEYADDIEGGAALPPLRAKRDGGVFYLYDGFHRLQAYQRAGFDRVPVEWEDGTLLDAREASCAVNAAHGLRRTNADKRNAVRRMFEVMAERGENWSDREIARRCGVGERHPAVASIRSELSAQIAQIDAPRTVIRNGTTYTQHVANIGRRTEPTEPADRPVVLVDRGSGEIVGDDRLPSHVVGSGNVFADLGVPDADDRLARARDEAVVHDWDAVLADERRDWWDGSLAEAWERLRPLAPDARARRVTDGLQAIAMDTEEPVLFEAAALIGRLAGERP